MSGPIGGNVLVVCVGNQCRSPLAHLLLQQRLPSAAGLVVSSAGTYGPPGRAMEAHAASELVRLGGDPRGFESRRLDRGSLASQDLVLTATRDLRTEVVAAAPRLMRRAFTLLEIAHLVEGQGLVGLSLPDLVAQASRARSRAPDDLDLVDPMGRDEQVHRQVADRIAWCVDRIAGAIS